MIHDDRALVSSAATLFPTADCWRSRSPFLPPPITDRLCSGTV